MGDGCEACDGYPVCSVSKAIASQCPAPQHWASIPVLAELSISMNAAEDEDVLESINQYRLTRLEKEEAAYLAGLKEVTPGLRSDGGDVYE